MGDMDYAQNVTYYGDAEHVVPELGQPEPLSDELISFVKFQVSEFSEDDSEHLSKLEALTQNYPGLLDELLMEEVAAVQHIRETEEDEGFRLGRPAHAIEVMINASIEHHKTELLNDAFNKAFPERNDAHAWSYDYKKGKINEVYGFPRTLASVFESDPDSE